MIADRKPSSAEAGEIETRILEFCAQIVDGAAPTAEEDLLQRGVDSLAAAELVAKIEVQWDVDVVGFFFDHPTARETAAEVQRQLQAGRGQ